MPDRTVEKLPSSPSTAEPRGRLAASGKGPKAIEEVEDAEPIVHRVAAVARMLRGAGRTGNAAEDQTILTACTSLARILDDENVPPHLMPRLQAELENVRTVIADWACNGGTRAGGSTPPAGHQRLLELASLWKSLGRDPVELAPARIRAQGGINVAYEYLDRDVNGLLAPLDGSGSSVVTMAPLNRPEDLRRALQADLQEHGDRDRVILVPLNLSATACSMGGHWTGLVVTVTQGEEGPVATAVYLDPLRARSSLPRSLEAYVRSSYDAAPWSFQSRPIVHGVQRDATSCGVHVAHDLRQIAERWLRTGQGPAESVPWEHDIVEVRRQHARLLAADDDEFWVRQIFDLHWVPQVDLRASYANSSSQEAVCEQLAALPPDQADRVLAQPSAECLRQTATCSGSFVQVQAGPYGTADDVVRRAANTFRESASVTAALALMPPEAATRLTDAFSNDADPSRTAAAVRRVLMELLGEAAAEDGGICLGEGPVRQVCRNAFLAAPSPGGPAVAASAPLTPLEALGDGIARFQRILPVLTWLHGLPGSAREHLLDVARTQPSILGQEAMELSAGEAIDPTLLRQAAACYQRVSQILSAASDRR